MSFDDTKNSYGAVDLEGGQTSSHIKDAAAGPRRFAVIAELLPLGLAEREPQKALQADAEQCARQHRVPVRLRGLLAARTYPARHQGLERLRKLHTLLGSLAFADTATEHLLLARDELVGETSVRGRRRG